MIHTRPLIRSAAVSRALRALGGRGAGTSIALAALAAFATAVFLPLLGSPERFPAGGDSRVASRAIVDSEVRSSWERTTGKTSWLDPAFEGRSRAGDGAAFHTHPLFYLASRFLPGGQSLSLLVLLHALVLAGGAWVLSRRLGLGAGPALFAGAAAMATGGAVGGLAAPGGLGTAAAASLVPLAALLIDALRRRPSLPRIAFLALAVGGMSLAGNLTALAAALSMSLLWALLLLREDERTAPAGPDLGRPGASRVRRAPGLAAAALLGVLLAAYRMVPLALDDPRGFLGLSGLAAGPWWAGSAGGLRLPFFAGAVTLVAIAAGAAGGLRSPRGLALSTGAVAFAALAPPALLPFLGLPLAIAGAAGAARLGAIAGGWLPVGALLAAALMLEALPYHHRELVGRSAEDIASAPRWVELLGKVHGGERVAILGAGGEGLEAAMAWRGILPSRVGSADDLNAIDDLSALAHLGTKFIVSRLPDSRRRLPLVQADRRTGMYVYLNRARLGPAYWTQRVERAGGVPRGGVLAGLTVPERMGAVILPQGEDLPDPPGEAFGVVRSFRRLPDGMRLDVSVPGECYLVITEPWIEGRLARVDGSPVPLFRANSSQVGLGLRAGRHEVVLDFEPRGLAAGSTLSALALAVLPVLLAAPLLQVLAGRSRRRRSPLSARLPSSLPAPRRARWKGAIRSVELSMAEDGRDLFQAPRHVVRMVPGIPFLETALGGEADHVAGAEAGVPGAAEVGVPAVAHEEDAGGIDPQGVDGRLEHSPVGLHEAHLPRDHGHPEEPIDLDLPQ